MFRIVKALCVAVLCVFAFTSCSNQPRVSFSAKKKVIITSNNTYSRIIADLAQAYTGVTFIVYEAPTVNAPKGKIFPCLPTNETPEALSVAQLANCIYSYAPREVIILGDDRYIPTSVENDINTKLASKNILVTRYSNDNWELQAKYLGRALLCERIGYDFPKSKKEYDNAKAESELQRSLK